MTTKVFVGLDQRNAAAGKSSQQSLVASSQGKKIVIFSGSVDPAGLRPGANSFVSVDPAQVDQSSVVDSQDSTLAFHSTLFENFELHVSAIYNFYTVDEQSSFLADVSASLSSIPRYVELTWKVTPSIQILTATTKGLRPDNGASNKPGSALDISVAKGSVSNGYISPGVISALLVKPANVSKVPSLNEDLFLSSPSSAGMSAADVADDPNSGFQVFEIAEQSERIRVGFVDPSIAGAVSPTRVGVSKTQMHLTAIGAVAKLLGGFEVISEFNQDVPVRNPPPKFPVSADTPGLIYIGYVIERYTLDQNGAMTLSMTADIDDPTVGRFIDRQVVFGGRYAYRIKSLVQWTRPDSYDFFGQSLLDSSPAFDASRTSLTKRASFYSGDWSDWVQTTVVDTMLPGPPDEFTVRPVSPKKSIHVSWKMPWDPQRDIASMHLLRSVVQSEKYSDWVQLAEFVPGNGLYIDRDVTVGEDSQESYMYAMYSTSFHGERSVLTARLEARLTDRVKYLGEEPIRQVDWQGADPMDHAAGPPERIQTELIASEKFIAYIRGAESSLPLFDRSYVVEVQSISTGERVEIDLSVDSVDVDLPRGGVSRRA